MNYRVSLLIKAVMVTTFSAKLRNPHDSCLLPMFTVFDIFVLPSSVYFWCCWLATERASPSKMCFTYRQKLFLWDKVQPDV